MRDDLASPNLGSAPKDYNATFFNRALKSVELTIARFLSKGPVQITDLTVDTVTATTATVEDLTVTTDLFVGDETDTGSLNVRGISNFGSTSTFNADILIAEDTPKLTLRDTNGVGTAASTWVAFEDSTPTRLGYVGYGSTGTDTFYINNETATGDVEIRTNGTPRLTVGTSSITNSLATTITANAAPILTLNRTSSLINSEIRYQNDAGSVYAGLGAAGTFSIGPTSNLATGSGNWMDVTDGKVLAESTSTSVSVTDLTFDLYRDINLTATGGIGRLEFNGNNSSGTKTYFAGVAGTAGGAVSAGAEYGYLYLQTVLNGTPSNIMRVGGVDSLVEVLQGKLKFPATQSSSSDPNVLDDYEEGEWTPVVIGATTAGTGTYTSQIGAYTKIGTIVHISLTVAISAHTGTGAMRITGLPFGGASQNHTLSCWSSSLPNTLQVLTSGTQILFYDGMNTATTMSVDTAFSLRITGTYLTS